MKNLSDTGKSKINARNRLRYSLQKDMEKRQILKIVADNIRNLLIQQGLSSTELSKKCHVSSGTISKIINGNMSITIPMAFNLAEGLGVSVNDVLSGLSGKKIKEEPNKKVQSSKNEQLSIGVLSINNKRITCVKNHTGVIIGTSELEGGLDLAETSSNLIQLIQESIYAALPGGNADSNKLKDAKLNLVTQSYEFEDTRSKFAFFAKRFFKDVVLMSDWQITYLASFEKSPGISLITDKGVSLSYMHSGKLKKLGGWKFPVYDLGGENWLGVETIRHTIEATEGYIPMSKLASNVLAKYNGKIEKITETCFKGEKNPDIYCVFTELLLRSYSANDNAARTILENGYYQVYRSIEKVDSILGNKLKIAINGSLADIYKSYFPKNRLVTPPSDADKVGLLADITGEFLAQHGIENV